jgi:hypothetical protein
MTEILSLGNLLRLARDTVSNPREGRDHGAELRAGARRRCG